MRIFLALALASSCLAPTTASAHSKDDEAACRPDVFRLCSADIPNESRIVACLERNKRQLGPDCFRVFNRTPAGAKVTPAASDNKPVQWGR